MIRKTHGEILRVCFPGSFWDIGLKVKNMAQNDQIYHFYLDFWVKNVLFKGQYLKKSLGNIPSKFYHDLYTPKIIEKWVYCPWRSFLPWDRFCLILLWKDWSRPYNYLFLIQKKCTISSPYYYKVIPPMSYVTIELEVDNCPGINSLEHVSWLFLSSKSSRYLSSK